MIAKTIDDPKAELDTLVDQPKQLRERLLGRRHNNGDRIHACTALRPHEADNLFKLDQKAERVRRDIAALEAGGERRGRRRRESED